MRNGIRICKPTGSPAFAVTGSGSQTAAIVGQGSVEFANAASLSLNGVFSSDYDNYMIVCRLVKTSGTGNPDLDYRLRASSVDANASNYIIQSLVASSTTISGSRSALITFGRVGSNFLNELGQTNGFSLYFYGPHLSQPTAIRSVTASAQTGAYINDVTATHSLSSSYDGFTLFPESTRTMSGLISVYGLVN